MKKSKYIRKVIVVPVLIAFALGVFCAWVCNVDMDKETIQVLQAIGSLATAFALIVTIWSFCAQRKEFKEQQRLSRGQADVELFRELLKQFNEVAENLKMPNNVLNEGALGNKRGKSVIKELVRQCKPNMKTALYQGRSVEDTIRFVKRDVLSKYREHVLQYLKNQTLLMYYIHNSCNLRAEAKERLFEIFESSLDDDQLHFLMLDCIDNRLLKNIVEKYCLLSNIKVTGCQNGDTDWPNELYLSYKPEAYAYDPVNPTYGCFDILKWYKENDKQNRIKHVLNEEGTAFVSTDGLDSKVPPAVTVCENLSE